MNGRNLEVSMGMKALNINGRETNGLIENLLSAFIFFSPNFLLLLFPDKIYLFLIYNYIIIFIIISILSHLKFRRQSP